jgi:hypothetical protein
MAEKHAFFASKKGKNTSFLHILPQKMKKTGSFLLKKSQKNALFCTMWYTCNAEILPELNFYSLHLFQFPNAPVHLHFADRYFHHASIIKLLF